MRKNVEKMVWGALLTVAVAVGGGCSDNNEGFAGGPNNNGSVFWGNGQSGAFSGAFGWNDAGVSQTALVSGTSCDNLDASVDITNGYSIDPCSLVTNDDGSPFNGTLTGVVCDGSDDSETNHTVTCAGGFITDTTQEIGSNVGFVTIFITNDVSSGNMGGRAGADAFCVANAPSGIAQANIRALVSISDSDEVRDMPANYGVPTNQEVFNLAGDRMGANWADILDDSIENAVDTGTPTGYWTATDSNGGVSKANCDGFTDATSSNYGLWGGSLETNGGWLGFDTNSCDAESPVLCIAFD